MIFVYGESCAGKICKIKQNSVSVESSAVVGDECPPDDVHGPSIILARRQANCRRNKLRLIRSGLQVIVCGPQPQTT